MRTGPRKRRPSDHVSESMKYRRAKEYRTQVRILRAWFYDHHIDINRIALQFDMDAATVRGIVSYRIAGHIE